MRTTEGRRYMRRNPGRAAAVWPWAPRCLRGSVLSVSVCRTAPPHPSGLCIYLTFTVSQQAVGSGQEGPQPLTSTRRESSKTVSPSQPCMAEARGGDLINRACVLMTRHATQMKKA